MALHPRRLAATLVDRLAKRPVTVLTGARQTGKTTLVRDLLPDTGGPPAIYFSLDDPDERLRLGADPVRRLDHGARLVILDEVQKHPELLDAVKLLADRGEGRRFLLLGSAQIMLLRQVRESRAVIEPAYRISAQTQTLVRVVQREVDGRRATGVREKITNHEGGGPSPDPVSLTARLQGNLAVALKTNLGVAGGALGCAPSKRISASRPG